MSKKHQSKVSCGLRVWNLLTVHRREQEESKEKGVLASETLRNTVNWRTGKSVFSSLDFKKETNEEYVSTVLFINLKWQSTCETKSMRWHDCCQKLKSSTVIRFCSFDHHISNYLSSWLAFRRFQFRLFPWFCFLFWLSQRRHDLS